MKFDLTKLTHVIPEHKDIFIEDFEDAAADLDRLSGDLAAVSGCNDVPNEALTDAIGAVAKIIDCRECDHSFLIYHLLDLAELLVADDDHEEMVGTAELIVNEIKSDLNVG